MTGPEPPGLMPGLSVKFCGVILCSGRTVPVNHLKGVLWRLGIRTASQVGPRCGMVVTDCPDMVTPFDDVATARSLGIPVVSSYDFFDMLYHMLVGTGNQNLGYRQMWTDMSGTYGP